MAADEKLFIGFHLVINGWTFEEMLDSYGWTKASTIKILTTLDQLKLIELLPENKIKLLTDNVILWKKNAPVRKRYEEQIRYDDFRHHSYRLRPRH